MQRPNIFDFATSELSQDAFLAWLISWAHEDFQSSHPELNQVAVRFVRALLDKPDYVIEKVKVKKQWKNIDLYAIINGEYFILIEDKKGTKEHSDQLNTYVAKASKEENFDHLKRVNIYFKMEDQSDLSKVEDADYRPFDRKEMLKCLTGTSEHPLPKSSHPILVDYIEHLEELEKDYNSFKTADISKWTTNAWKGFFAHLQKELDGKCHWQYLNNRSGGYVGLWWFPVPGFPIYLQLNQDRLIFRMEVQKSDSDPLNTRRALQEQFLNLHTDLNFKKFGNPGKNSPTMGLVQSFKEMLIDGKNKKVPKDYRITVNGKIDLTATVIFIKGMKDLIARVKLH